MIQAAGIYYQFSSGNGPGPRPAVVLLHGAGGNHLYWPAMIRRLSGYDVYTLDLPGHARSDAIEQPSIERYTDCITGWLEAVNLERAFFVGHSMGSAIAMQLALTAPHSALGLVLVGSSAHLKVNPELLESMDDSAAFQMMIEKIIRWSFSAQSPHRLKELAARRMAETRPEVFTRDFVACARYDFTQRLEQIHCPVIVICGSEDRMTPPADSQALAASLPHACLEIVPGAGHMLMLEQPQTLTELLVSFLDQNRV